MKTMKTIRRRSYHDELRLIQEKQRQNVVLKQNRNQQHQHSQPDQQSPRTSCKSSRGLLRRQSSHTNQNRWQQQRSQRSIKSQSDDAASPSKSTVVALYEMTGLESFWTYVLDDPPEEYDDDKKATWKFWKRNDRNRMEDIDRHVDSDPVALLNPFTYDDDAKIPGMLRLDSSSSEEEMATSSVAKALQSWMSRRRKSDFHSIADGRC
uniref:Uncharacterized protein n=1 Tax=Craspedostauros australis TaxID=1486917 RepID=A0A7R9ZMS4_9STRA|mmetsp:Transcript_23887/g.66752  ORF Transcript_23887/g.66752 Transcript_23887/m.66752 type:complete len:208 (+) Transcript_23887:232-855(+)